VKCSTRAARHQEAATGPPAVVTAMRSPASCRLWSCTVARSPSTCGRTGGELRPRPPSSLWELTCVDDLVRLGKKVGFL